MEVHYTKIGVVSGLEASMIEDAKNILSILKKSGAALQIEEKLAAALKTSGYPLKKIHADVIAVIGSDRSLLNTLLQLGPIDTPILPISSKGQPDFLFDVTAPNFETIVSDLLDQKWSEERRSRLIADIAGKSSPPLLNDLALFARRSATLIRYSLFLDGEQFWKDGSDGLSLLHQQGAQLIR